jgi:hypothetical protein
MLHAKHQQLEDAACRNRQLLSTQQSVGYNTVLIPENTATGGTNTQQPMMPWQ